mgnify:FL=1
MYHSHQGDEFHWSLFANFLHDYYKKRMRGNDSGKTFLPRFKHGYKLTVPIFINETENLNGETYPHYATYEDARKDLLFLALCGLKEFYKTDIAKEVHLKKNRNLLGFDRQKTNLDTKVGLEIIALKI